MKTICLTTMIVVFMLICSNGILSQNIQPNHNQVCLDNTEQFSIISKYVEDETYIIQVGLPIDYSPSKKSYPVLYVLDGDKSFGMTKEIIDWLIWNNEIKDIIVVAISYGKGTDSWWEKRARDYLFCKDTAFKDFSNAGGADNFLKFVKIELFPIVNNKYRTKEDSTAIMGLSFGGLLSAYVLFTQPDIFKSYIIIAPALVWNDNGIIKMEADYFNKHKELNKMVYMAYGTLDNKDWIVNPTNELIKMLQMHNYAGLSFMPQVFEGETHISVYPIALTHGLKAIFKR